MHTTSRLLKPEKWSSLLKANMKKVVFKIDKQGGVKIEEISGYGSDCKNLTELLEKSLGSADESSREYTAEYYETKSEGQNDLHTS